MDEIRRILVFILCGIGAVSALSVKGYFCRDPDTGKLYAANSTWPSSSFCGNYTCKLRKKVPLENELLRKFNITHAIMTQTVEPRQDDTQNDGDFAASNITPQIVKPTHTPDVFDKEKLKDDFQNQLNDIQVRLDKKLEPDSNDRFLTDTEIKTLSDLLHNLKKSDLEAIVDIYKLAQDIYQEMDKVTSENILEETVKIAQNIKTQRANDRQTSYWYEPLNKYQKVEAKPDMQHQSTNPVPTTVQPKPAATPEMYFTGALSSDDFGKLPYFYPMSSFQRQSSYVHPTYIPQPQHQLPPVNVKPPCPNKNPVAYPPPIQYNPPPQSYQVSQNTAPQTYSQNYGVVMKRPFTVESQRLMQPSKLLPYPFSYVQHYNMSNYPFNFYHAGNPWGGFDASNRNGDLKPNQVNSPKNAIHDTGKKISSKSKDEKEKNDILDGNLLENLLAHAKIVKKPDWQTDPIPAEVLEEVRAHFEDKIKLLKPFAWRKKVKLERVGKVVKLDELHRERRSIAVESKDEVDDRGDFETYLEKTICMSNTDPGFYKMGNLSEPYPACCPKKIDSKR